MAPVQEIEDNTSCPAGGSKRFECQVIGLPRPSVRWYKDGINITTNSRYKFEYTPDGCIVLVLENVTAKDQGVYACRAQNSEGSAETVAQLYIKGKVSEVDVDAPSIHTMSSFKKVENEDDMTQSQRRPLMVEMPIDSNIEPPSVHREALHGTDDNESEEKGTLETKQQKHGIRYDIGDEMEAECSDEETQKAEELANVVEDLLELTKFGNSGRRLTTDSGITSRGSSFSSEPDINITEDSIQEMKEYLHGKADALYQPFEIDKVKDINESDIKIVVARSEKQATNEKAKHLKSQIMSMANLKQEKCDTDRVNELEASVLAGMYLFDTGPSKLDVHRHGIPSLELLVRKEALEAIPDDERRNGKFEKLGLDSSISNTGTEISQTNIEYQTAEIIHESETGDNNEVEILNAINIERNSETIRIHEEEKYIKIKTMRYVEDDEEGQDEIRKGEEALDVLAEDKCNDKMTMEFKGHLNSDDAECRISKNEHDAETDGEIENDTTRHLIHTDVAIETGSSKEAIDKSSCLSSSSDVNNDANTCDNNNSTLDWNCEGETSALKPKESCQNNVQSQIEEYVDTTQKSNIDGSGDIEHLQREDTFEDQEKIRETKNNETIENKNDSLLSANKIAEEEELDEIFAFKHNGITKGGPLPEPINVKYPNHTESGTRLSQESSDFKDKSDGAQEHDSETMDNGNNFEDDDSIENNKDKNKLICIKRKTDMSGLLDHDQTDDSEGRIEAGKYLFVNEDWSEIDNKHVREHEYHVKHEPKIITESKAETPGDPTLTNVQSQTSENNKRDSLEASVAEEHLDKDTGLIANSSVVLLGNTNDPSVEADSYVYTKTVEPKTADNKIRLRSSCDENSSDRNIHDSSERELELEVSTSDIQKEDITNGSGLADINVDKEITANETELRLIGEISEAKSGLKEENAEKDLDKIKNECTETKKKETRRNMDNSTVTTEQHRADMNQLENVYEHIEEPKTSKEVMLYSADESSDSGRQFSEPLKDIDLIHIDDTIAEVPNVINVQDNFKQNEIRTVDASLTEEIENKSISLKEISEDQDFIRAKETKATNSFVVASTDEINTAFLEKESFQLAQYNETGLKGNKSITKETNDISDGKMKECDKKLIDKESEKELQMNKTVEEVQEVIEHEISPKTTKVDTAETVIDLDKLKNDTFKESEQEVSEQQVIQEYLQKENDVPDIDKLCTVEKAMNESIKTMPSNATLNEVNEEYIIPESANEDKATNDIYGDKQLVEKIRSPNVDKCEPTVEVLLDDTNVQVTEGVPVKLSWKIKGIAVSDVDIFKGGQTIVSTGSIQIHVRDDVISLNIDNVAITDEAVYTVRIQDSDKDQGDVRLKVNATVSTDATESAEAAEPQFVVEPVVDVEDGRRLSIKCSVTGFPAPQVTWYHHGKQLNQDVLWEIYSKDGYHYLGVGDQSLLNTEEIVCRVENGSGYVQRVVRVKRDGEEVYCEPVLPPVSPELSEVTDSSPSIEINISEIVTANLRKILLASDYTDRLNLVTLNAGDIVEVLAYETERTVLARNIPHKDKVCYIPVQALTVSDDVSSQVCENAAIKNNTKPSEEQLYQNKEKATMPERRKMKSPSPKMTSTPKMKRKEMDAESSEELQKRLGYSDNSTQKKEFSTKDSVEFTEYNDGTTRPMFKKRLKSVTAKSGEMAQLECTVSGSPLPKILWLKNNRPLKACDGCKVIVDEGTNILVFPQAREEDVGIYTARAMNVNGSIMCSAEFTLSDGRGLPAQPVTDSPMDMDFTTPAYFFQMSSCEVAEGRLARFDCRVVAYPKPEIVWMRDGKVVEAEQRFKLLNFNNEIYSLLIQDVRIEDTGRYTCWARNKFGEAMTEAYLNVIALTEQEPEGDIAPKFLTRFYDQQTTEGTATDFKCLIAGRPEPSVTWLLDDLEIHGEQGVKMRLKDGVVSLEIKSPKVDQSGTYTCQLNNTLGEATCSARLTVVEDKLHGKMLPKFLKKFDHVTAKEGEEARFTSVIVGEPRPDVTWLFDHKPISDTNRRFQMKKEGDAYTLIIKNVRFDDGGKITCKASNEEGEVYCSANLHVRESKYMRDVPEQVGVKGKDETDSKFGYIPTFTKRLQDVEVKEGAKATFECKVMGIPDPEISWMKDGRVISPGGRFHMTLEGGTGQLVIDNVTAADTGVYTCIVSNSQGKSSSTAALKLEEPKKERYTPDTLLEERTSRKERYTPDKYLLDDSTSAKRPYLDSDRYDKYDKYDDETSKQLDLPEMRAPPRLPTHRPIITDLGEETLRLAWRPVETYQSKRAPPVSYRLEAKELPGKDWMPLSSRLRDTTHYLSELPHDRDYMIRVRAENDYGMSEPTEPLWLPRATAFPGVPVTRPQIIDYEDTRAKLSWSRVDIPAFGSDDAPLLYMLEVEEPPHKDWRTIARDLDDTEYIVEGLRPDHDYRFRVRAKTPTGIVSEPSPAVSLYTKLAQTRAPVDRLEVLEYEPDTRSVNLSWDRVNIPPYNIDEEPLMYMLEYQEPPLPEWRTLITGIPTTRYRVMHLDKERDYNFRVRALTPYGVSPPSPVLPVTMRQTPVTRGLPEKVIISEVEPHSLRLTWQQPMYDLDKPINYQVEMLESPFSEWRPIATKVLETTYKVTGLKPTRDYQFRVIPQVGSGYLTPSPSAALTTTPVKPRLPYKEPKLKELTPESVQLSWGSAEVPAYQRKYSPIHYKVEMAELPSSNWVPVARRVPESTYNVTGLRPNQEYKFRVFAESDSGLSEPSMPVTLYRKPAPKFSLKEPSIRDISQNIVHLNWTPAEFPDSSESVSYMVEMQTPPGISSWSVLHRKHPSPSVRLADLRPDLDYLVRVRAQCGSYRSEPTHPVYIPRRAAPPRLPVEEPYAVDINSDYVKLQWRSAELPTHIQDYAPVTYRLEAQEFPDTNWVAIARGIPHTDFKVTGLNPQRDYNFRVRAENEYGLSDPTHPMLIRKRSVAPVLPVSEPLLYDVGPGSARLSWRPATLPTFAPSQSSINYTLFVQELPFKTWRPLVKGIPHTSYYVSGLQPDKEYMFRVQAENQFGSSKPTESVLLKRFKDFTRPVSIPEVSDFDEDLTSVKLRWAPTTVSPLFDKSPRKYTVETWEPVRREWKPVARGVPDTTYQIRELPKMPDHLFRVRMDTEEPTLSEPSLPISLSRYRLPRAPMYRPQLYEVDDESVRLSWQPVHVPEGVSRRSIRYTIEQREIPEPHWSPVASEIMETSYKVRGLRAKYDYEFRVKAMYDGTSTEPSYPVSLYRRAVIPKVKFDAPEVYDVDATSLSLRWNTVDVPAFTNDEEPLLFVIERQTLPSYEWQPVATNVTDKTYTVRDLQPYQDYNFRVRGVYPSGYTEPSPYVPVYRRPSESKIGLVGLESSTLEYKSYGSQKYSSKSETSKTLPTAKLHATLPSTELSPITKKAIETRLRSYVSSPHRRYSVANIYDSREVYSKEAEYRPEPTVPAPEVRFKLENAYVYKRSRSPVKVELPTVYDTVKAGEHKKIAPKKENDLYEWYRQLHRRYSDVGIEELTRRKSRKSLFIQEKLLEERRAELILEAQQTRLAKRGSVPTVKTKTPNVVHTSEPSVGYPSVADRYEDIKCPFIVSPGHWKFGRRHSVALDWEDLQRLQRQLQIESKRLETKRRTRSEMPKTNKPKYDFISQSQADYFGGTYFHIEDQLNFNDMRPRIPRADLTTPYVRRSLSQERDPGYFMISKFTLSVAGVKGRKPASRATPAYVRPATLEPSPVARLPRQYRSYTPEYRSYTPDSRSLRTEYRSYTPDYRSYTPEYRSYSPEHRSLPKTRSLTPDLYYDYRSRSETPEYHDLDKIKQRSTSLAQDLARSKLYGSGYKSVSRSSTESHVSPVKPIRKPSPPRQKEAFVKPRSYSISVPRAEVKKFNRVIEDSKSLIGNYERLDQRSRSASVAKVPERRGSVADIRSDPRFTSTPRGSMSGQHTDVHSDPRYTSTPRGSMSGQHPEVHSDPRYTSTPRGSMSAKHVAAQSDPRYSRTRRSSVTMSQAEREKLSSMSAIQSDARFSAHRRATIATNDDLKSKLDSITSSLSVPKPKRKKSRPVIKFKSSRGEGAL